MCIAVREMTESLAFLFFIFQSKETENTAKCNIYMAGAAESSTGSDNGLDFSFFFIEQILFYN